MSAHAHTCQIYLSPYILPLSVLRSRDFRQLSFRWKKDVCPSFLSLLPCHVQSLLRHKTWQLVSVSVLSVFFFFFWEEEGSLKLFACPSVYLPLYMPIQTTVWGFLFVSVIDFNESLSRSFIFFSFTSRKTLTKICADNFLWLMFNYFKVISIFVGLISQSLKARRWSSKRYSSYRATSKSIFKTDRSERILKVGILQMLLF